MALRECDVGSHHEARTRVQPPIPIWTTTVRHSRGEKEATAKRQEHVSSIRIRVDAVADSGCDVNGKNDVDHSHNNLHNKLYHGHECREAEEGKDMVVRMNHGGGGKEMLPQ